MALRMQGSMTPKGKHEHASPSPQTGLLDSGSLRHSVCLWRGPGGTAAVGRTLAPALASVFATSCPTACRCCDSRLRVLISWGVFDPSAALHPTPVESVFLGLPRQQQTLSFTTEASSQG